MRKNRPYCVTIERIFNSNFMESVMNLNAIKISGMLKFPRNEVL